MAPRDGVISTHTLTWSVTDVGAAIIYVVQISTHTLTWSVTSPPIILHEHHGYFNSHAHVERDHHVELTDGGKYNFNSHAHVERDFIPWFAMTNIKTFQLTRSRGA